MTDEKTLIHIQSIISQLGILCDFAEVDVDEGESARAAAYFDALVVAKAELQTVFEELVNQEQK